MQGLTQQEHECTRRNSALIKFVILGKEIIVPIVEGQMSVAERQYK